MSTNFGGSCLCGAVRFESAEAPMVVGHCHCVDCRKSSGTGHCTHLAVSKNAFTVTGDVRFYDHPADSGNIVSRGFCPTCGCPIYSKNSGMAEMVFPRASGLDDPDIVTPQLAVYVSRAASWDFVDPSLPTYAEMPDGGPREADAQRVKS